MIKRIVSAFVLIPIVLFFLLYPAVLPVLLFFLAASCLLAWEILALGRTRIHRVTYPAIYASLAVLYFWKFRVLTGAGELDILPVMALPFAIISIYFVFKKDFSSLMSSLGYGMLAVFYGGIIFSYGLDIRFVGGAAGSAYLGSLYLVYLLTVCWMYDTGGYFIGRAFGKVKLGLASSPNKSWAGLFGGLGFAVIGFLVFRYIYLVFFPDVLADSIFQADLGRNLILTLVLALLSQLGDLVESIMKRASDIKDSGSLIAGHGGIFDAIDSVIPLMYIFYLYIS